MNAMLCDFSDLPTDRCALECCRDVTPAKVPHADRLNTGHFTAKWDGQCRQPGCGNPIDAGDRIRYVDDRLACVECS